LVRIAKWQNPYGPAIAVINNFFERMRGRRIELLVEQMRLTTPVAQDESQCSSGDDIFQGDPIDESIYTRLGLEERDLLDAA
jgi:hypothetical protein